MSSRIRRRRFFLSVRPAPHSPAYFPRGAVLRRVCARDDAPPPAGARAAGRKTSLARRGDIAGTSDHRVSRLPHGASPQQARKTYIAVLIV